jgi:hypothetical protein
MIRKVLKDSDDESFRSIPDNEIRKAQYTREAAPKAQTGYD